MIVIERDRDALAELRVGFIILVGCIYVSEALDPKGEIELGVFIGKLCNESGLRNLPGGGVVPRSSCWINWTRLGVAWRRQ